MRRLARRLHRYLLLIVGVQMLLWSVSGLYMVWFDIHYIHGDHFMKSSRALSSLSTLNVGFDEIVARYPDAKSIVLGSVGEMPVYRLTLTSKTHLISGLSGDVIQPLSDKQAAAIAMSRSSRSYEVDNVTLLGENEEDSPVGQRDVHYGELNLKAHLRQHFTSVKTQVRLNIFDMPLGKYLIGYGASILWITKTVKTLVIHY